MLGSTTAALVQPVVRVGHHRRVVVVRVAHEQLNLVAVLRGRAVLQLREVFPVHNENEIRRHEVFGRDDLGAMLLNVETALAAWL